MSRLTPIRLAGSSLAIGRAHGELLRERIHGFLDDDLCRLNRLLDRRTSLAALAETIGAHGAAIARDTPDLHDELRGLAEGAGIGLDAAILLQIRREVMGYSRIPAGGDCTTLCRVRPGGAWLAQTIDLSGDLDDHMGVLGITHAASGRRVLVVTFTGLLGYLGLNGDGLAIGLNLVLGGCWRPGVPPYLAIRHLLDHCDSVDTCLERLPRLRLASSRSLTLCDRHGLAATVELLDGQMAVTRGVDLVHTNHFLAEAFRADDAINPFARNSSVRRLEAGRARLAGLGDEAGPEEVLAQLAEEPIRVRGTGNPRRERTVGAVVLCPQDGLLHLRRGDPALAETQIVPLHA